jgi:hypothetical protein
VGTIVLCQLFELWTWTECTHGNTGTVGELVPGSILGLRVEPMRRGKKVCCARELQCRQE